jgi:DNA-binding transcriptional LysR family regulator
MSCSLRIGVLPAALRDCAAVPDVQVRLVEFRHTRDLTAATEAGRADLAVGPTPPVWDGLVREIGAEEFVLAAAPVRNCRPEPGRQGLPPIRSMSSSLVTPYDSRTSAAKSRSTGSGRTRRASSASSGNPVRRSMSTTSCLADCIAPAQLSCAMTVYFTPMSMWGCRRRRPSPCLVRVCWLAAVLIGGLASRWPTGIGCSRLSSGSAPRAAPPVLDSGSCWPAA